MQVLSATRQKALQKAQECFRAANLHPASQQFREDCISNYGYYDGRGQWSEVDLKKLQRRGQDPITVNICKGFIDNLSGVEIQSRYRTACRSDSYNPEDERLADALTHLLLFVQENQDMPYKGSLKFRDALICGIGWSHVVKENGQIFYDYVHPFNVIPDPDDLTSQYSNMKYVCRKYWMRPDLIKSRWPKAAGYIDVQEEPGYYQGMFSPEIMDRGSSYTDSTGTGSSAGKNRSLVVEVQYKMPHKYFSGTDENGRTFETFNLETAEDLAVDPKEIEEIAGERIMRTIFCDDVLLEHAPLAESLPNQKDFSYIPIVYQRQFSTGVPYGLLHAMKDIQRDCNVRITKAVHSINSSRVIFEGNPMPGQDVEKIRQELQKTDSIIVLPKDSKFQITSNAQLGEEQVKVVELYLDLMQRVTGIYDEMLGIPTNATSGVAQSIRQVNSVRNNVFAFDNFSSMKRREARLILDCFQGANDYNLAAEVLEGEEREVLILNWMRTIRGKKVIVNDIRTLPITLYVEEIPDYRSTFEEQKATFESLLSNAHAQWLMLSPELMRRLGVRNPEQIAEEMRKALQEKTTMEQGVAGRGAPVQFEGMPPANGMPLQQQMAAVS